MNVLRKTPKLEYSSVELETREASFTFIVNHDNIVKKVKSCYHVYVHLTRLLVST